MTKATNILKNNKCQNQQSKSFLNFFFQKNIVKKKVKVIKKEDEDKNSIIEEIKFKSQAAMEYLMTYGWAILIIALSLVVLYSLGIMNPKNFLPRTPPGSCFVFRPNGPGTTDFVSLQGTCGYLPMYVASFNGVNGYVQVPNSNILNISGSGASITVSMWINPKSLPPSGSYMSVIGKGLTVIPPWMLYFSGSKLTIDGLSTGVGASSTIFTSDRWYFATGIWTQTNASLYINSKLETTVGRSAPIDNRDPVGIGYEYYRHVYFNGSITNVQIYNTALSQQEIQYLYQQGLGGGPVRLQNLVLWLPLNGDAKDYSGNNNHGTINGGVTFVQNYNPP
jgi:hypothetical protein